LNSYYTIRKHLQAFIREKHRMADIPFGQMEEDFLECLQHHSVGKLGHSQPHYRTMALAVKKVCRLAYREGLTERQLFAYVEIERGENKQPRALAGASLDKLQALIFEPYEVELETARNLFLCPRTRNTRGGFRYMKGRFWHLCFRHTTRYFQSLRNIRHDTVNAKICFTSLIPDVEFKSFFKRQNFRMSP